MSISSYRAYHIASSSIIPHNCIKQLLQIQGEGHEKDSAQSKYGHASPRLQNIASVGSWNTKELAYVHLTNALDQMQEPQTLSDQQNTSISPKLG